MSDTAHDDLLAGFTAPQPYTMETVADAPRAPGVHVVLDGGVVIYVGRTRRGLRDRLRQHLTGNRDSSVRLAVRRRQTTPSSLTDVDRASFLLRQPGSARARRSPSRSTGWLAAVHASSKGSDGMIAIRHADAFGWSSDMGR